MPLSGHLTDPNYITQAPSGTLDNTALTLIQVLNLHRGLAVINLYCGLFSIACSYEDEDYRQNRKRPEAVFLARSYFVFYSWDHFSFSILYPLYFLISGYF